MQTSQPTSAAISNYKYLVYLLIRSTVSDYRTTPVLKKCKITMPRANQKALRRYMRNFMQETAELSYSKFLENLNGSDFQNLVIQNEQKMYLGGMKCHSLDFLEEAICRKDRQSEGLKEIEEDLDKQIIGLQVEIEKLENV
ncbi:hypothetical protein SS50377_24541 [Spironucleus salmonicida]|uniref:Uncharacterized protein n=1 Tax=Spironucleus salmonicida TaxID=348837 RepID=V6LMJ2_9EUKA|nr:hypothetical protein SS50377_24541 [Spironucleus salmonicida]|eukprot:EST45917.1 Hypothetical protein SS50377_13893 [Spironucleus salmonicida]